jgi:hypothetical protein
VSNRGSISCFRHGSQLVTSPRPIALLGEHLWPWYGTPGSKTSVRIRAEFLAISISPGGTSIDMTDSQNSTVGFLPKGKKGFPGCREGASTVGRPQPYLMKLREQHFRKFAPLSLTLFSNLETSPFTVISLSTQRKKFKDKL